MPEERPGTDLSMELDDPLGRDRWFYSSRVDEQGNIPPGLIARACAQRRRLQREAFSLLTMIVRSLSLRGLYMLSSRFYEKLAICNRLLLNGPYC